MARLKRVCIWLLVLIAVAWVGTALLRSHFKFKQENQHREFAHDQALDRNFDARSPTPLAVNVMVSTPNRNYQVPADLPSFHEHIASLGKLPAIIVLPGCGFAVRGKNVPMNVAVLSIDENPPLLTSKTSLESCISKDRRALQYALEQQLRFAMNYVQNANWIDRKRVMLVGSGEAAPIIAAYDGLVKQRLTVGDPCLVPWSNIGGYTPMLMLFTSDRQGLAREDEPRQSINIAAIARGAPPPLPSVQACIGLERPRIQPSIRQVTSKGRFEMLTMPAALESAQKAFYEEL